MGGDLQSKVNAALDDIEDYTSQDVISKAEEVKSAAKKLNGVTDYPYPDEYFEWIVPYYDRFHQRWPTYPQTMADHLTEVTDQLNSGQVMVLAGADTVLANWTGDAADSFKKNFIGAFDASPSCVDNQILVVNELQSALWIYSGILKTMRAGAVKIADATIAALEASDDMKNSGGQFELSLMGGLTTVITACAIPTATLPLAIIGAGLVMANAGVGKIIADKNDKIAGKISGDYVPEILNTMADRLNELESKCNEAETAIGESLDQSIGTIQEVLGSGNATTMMKLVPNESGDDGADVTDGQNNDIPEFRPTR
jgi:hypothetical protein